MKPLVITHNGASGVFAGCTDLAYEQAVNDGADVIDCSVQMTKDGVLVCLRSIDLTVGTTAMNAFSSRIRSIPEVQEKKGIFSIDLTLAEIQTLSRTYPTIPATMNLILNKYIVVFMK